MANKKTNNEPTTPSLLDACQNMVEFLTEAKKAGEVHCNADVEPILKEKLEDLRAAIKRAEVSGEVVDFEHKVFMVSGENLKKLSSGAMRLEEAAKLENVAVVAWTGADIMDMLKEGSEFMAGREALPQDLDVEDLIANIANDSSFHQWIIEAIYERTHAELNEMERQQASEPEKESTP